jgi:preprotein translocase subunit SecG
MTVEQLLEIISVASAILLIVLVLLHSPKSDGLGGLSGRASMLTRTKTAEKTVNRGAWALGLVFISSTIVLSVGWV